MMQEYQGADVSRVERTSCGGFFEGQEMCVMADDYRPFKTTKADLERAIHLNHGTFVQNPMSSTKFVIAASGRRLKVGRFCLVDCTRDSRSYHHRWPTLSKPTSEMLCALRGCWHVSPPTRCSPSSHVT